MTPPPFEGRAAERGAALIETPMTPQTHTTRGPTPPLYRPRPDYQGPVLRPDDHRWARLDALRQEAWNRGIPLKGLETMQRGCCPAQISQQITLLEGWIAVN